MKIELSLHAVGLKNVAGALKGTSDPFAVVTHLATEAGKKPEVLGKTEIVKNDLSPEWAKVFEFDYSLGTPMKLVVSVFDEVRKKENKSMGSAVFDVGELLGARGCTKAKKLQKGGKLFAHVRKSTGSGTLRLQLQGLQLKNTEGFLRKSDPFFEINRQINAAGANTWDNVFRSEVVKDNLNPGWKTAVVSLSTLCGGNLDLPLLFKVYDYESKGGHVPMGQFETTVKQLVAASTEGNLNDKSKLLTLSTKKGGKTGAVLVVKAQVSGIKQEGPATTGATAEVTQRIAATSISTPPTVVSSRPTFVDYVTGGLEFNVVVGIDFTGSNGNPRTPGTLHYMDPTGVKNDYEKAISSILTILAKYDTDKKFPVLGFGAKYNGVVHHAFQCGPTEEAHGVAGVLQAYKSVFKSGLIMSSPTDVTHVIENAAARAKSAQAAANATGKQVYTVLLLVTDGAVSDTQKTADCLNRISDAPLSVVIVGVGSADFSAMQFLDDSNSTSRRDIAQFVEFNKHKHDRVDLSSATLQEIPEQVVGYFESMSIKPRNAEFVDEAEIIVEDEEPEIDLSLDIGEDEIVVAAGGTQQLNW